MLSDVENIGVGMVGGVTETCLLMPVLTAKFCLQEGRPLPTNIGGWYRGVGVQAGNVAPVTAVQVFLNGVIEKYVFGATDTQPLSNTMKIVGSTMAGAGSAVLYSPVDLVNIQQQKLVKSPIDTAKYIMGNHGFFSLWRGVSAMAVREGIYTAGYLGLAPVLSSYFSTMPGREDKYLQNAIGACAIAGVTASLVTHPVDTAKTNVQADLAGKTFSSAIQAMPKLYAEGGIPAFYRGGLARCIRTVGAFIVVSSMREAMVQHKTAPIFSQINDTPALAWPLFVQNWSTLVSKFCVSILAE
jgi:hypothetical protein